MEATYIDHMGSDLTVVNAARVSFAKMSEWDQAVGRDELGAYLEDALSAKDVKLIAYLARHHHWTPFAHPQITLHMKAPIFIRTQCFKHKVGFTENEVSRRYVDDAPEFYHPIFRKRAENKKQGSLDEFPANYEGCETAYLLALDSCERVYSGLIKEGVAPEQARMVLPQSMYTEWYWTGSLAAFARFVKQRTDPHAQYEIQVLATQVGDLIRPLFPVSWSALMGD